MPDPKCLDCGRKLTAQWDTQGNENYLKCDHCGECYTLDLERAIPGMSIPARSTSEGEEDDETTES